MAAMRAGHRAAKAGHDGRLLRVIAVFKFLKSALLVGLSLGAFRLLHQDIGDRVERWVAALHLDPGNHYVELVMARAANLTPEQIKRAGLVGLLYAALFLLEGTGLWLQRRWGEWVTVWITGTLIPVEVYEMLRHPSPLKITALAVNVAVVAYLVHRIRQEGRSS